MIVLAVESATPQVGVALASAEGTLAHIAVREGRRHGEVLAPAVRDVCRLAGVRLADVDAVAVDVGPGLFTGLRVGIATAKALSSALGVPIVGISSLDVLVAGVARDPRAVAAVVDARRGEVFATAVAGADHGRPAAGPAVLVGAAARPPDVLADELAALGRPVLAVGDGALRYAERLSAVPAVEVGGWTEAFPVPAVLAALGATALAGGAGGDPVGIRPRYLREADVRIGWQQAPGTGSGGRAPVAGAGRSGG